jgi:hypothetical protein
MKHRFQPVNTRSDKFRCTTREGMATSFAELVSKRNAVNLLVNVLEGSLESTGRGVSASHTQFGRKSLLTHRPQYAFAAQVSAKTADTEP